MVMTACPAHPEVVAHRARLAEAILDCFDACDFYVMDDTGQKFQAITETDLMSRLRDKGWRLPGAGWFMGDVRAAGYTVKQGYEFKGRVRRFLPTNYRRPPAVSDYQTLIFL